ncbi:MAG: hypothetical protein HRU80_15125 [Ignavibacteriales bacterium]|nr:hypothetical protein [Ignavibacteriaceae bacterium]QOJ30129.1 MAG: hypothetical protein HRU80_15125 [Ignavibacteriales bacterium]
MKHKTVITTLSILIALFSIIAASTGIFSDKGTGPFLHETVRGDTVLIYGKGLYAHMSADVAVQGIAQDYITLFLGVPLLLFGLARARNNSLRGTILQTGTVFYFLLTYLFYLAMAMYNAMFPVYILLLASSLFCLLLLLIPFDTDRFRESIKSEAVYKQAGIFLIINAGMISLLWLSVIIPPVLEGTIIPKQVQHYTTLIVQGFDLAIFLPLAFVSGWMAVKKQIYGYLFTTVYMIFLSILMLALVSKILFMAAEGASVIPVIFIMPPIAGIAIYFSWRLLGNLHKEKTPEEA